MRDQGQKERRLKAAEQAAGWLLVLQSGQLSRQERAEFVDWLRESPLHIAEMLRACRLHRDLSEFARWEEIEPFNDQQGGQVVRLLPSHGLKDVPAPVTQSAGWTARRAVLLAACVAGIAILSVTVVARFGQIVLRTQSGERREATLADGSIVDLAPDSTVRVRYEAKERIVALERGEALFHVAKNPNRPFIVQAAATRVRAVGTVFNVERNQQGVSVTVVEGRVAVTQQQQPAWPGFRARPAVATTGLSLGMDEKVTISTAGNVMPVHKVNGQTEIAWAAGQLIFDNEPVSDVVRRFNLYNRVQLRVLDPKLAARRVSGAFRATDPDSFVAFVASAGGATVARPDADVILLGSPPAANGGSVQR